MAVAEFDVMPEKVVVTAAGKKVTFVPEGTVPELMGNAEVAAELGVKTSNLDAQVGMPAPAHPPLARGRLWRAKEIRAFARARRKAA